MATISGPRSQQQKQQSASNVAVDTVNGSTKTLPDAEVISAKFDLAIALALSSWPALTIAVQNQWGGPDSADKRDWLAGALSELFAAQPGTDAQDVEDMLLQVMADEFDLQVEDESEAPVAAAIMRARRLTEQGRFEEVDSLYVRWAEKQKRPEQKVFVNVQEHSTDVPDGEDVDWASGDEDSDESPGGVGVDVDMQDAPALQPTRTPREKPAPEIDEDGFMKVTSKKKR